MPEGGAQRVLVKLSGEAFAGARPFGLDVDAVRALALSVGDVVSDKIMPCLVVGGGNILRGAQMRDSGIERANADYMGMLATVINALALQGALERDGHVVRVMSAIPMQAVCEPYIRRRALSHIQQGRIVIFAAGTGNPFVTTDTAAALRAAEMGCDALVKATQVGGVYSDDPKTNPKAERYARLTYADVLARNLGVMDATAVSLCRDNAIPIVVSSVDESGAWRRALRGESGTLISGAA